jgi:pimeloyl-ACP methyl ester carboxylesterase
MKKSLLVIIIILSVLAIIYALGPRVSYKEPLQATTSKLPVGLNTVASYVQDREEKLPKLKTGNQARVVWADSAATPTEYVLLYLHGFSASQEEGAPLHTDIAERYGMNLYLSRLIDHGRLDSNTFKGITPADFVKSAWEELAIAQTLGEKVIIMSCSTGSTLSAYMAAQPGSNIHSQIMYSPNIDVYDPTAELLLYPWAKEIMDVVIGGDYRSIDYPPAAAAHWTPVYHTDGIVALKHLLEQTMTDETFAAITQPLFMGYYYKSEEEQDMVVSVEEMLGFYDKVGTEASQKVKVAFANAGHHVISSHVMSSDVDGVRRETVDFIENVLKIAPKK